MLFNKKPPKWLMLSIIIAGPALFTGCSTSSKNLNADLELKKQAIEDKNAIREMQLKENRNARPNHLALARTLADKGFYDIALNQLAEAKKTDARNPELFYLTGVCHRSKKAYETAVSQFKQALKYDPKFAPAHAGLGTTYHMMGNYEKAVSHHTQAISCDPGVASFYNNLGVALIAQGRPDQAATYFGQCIALAPNHRHAMNNLGLAYGLMGEDEKALAMFQRTGGMAAAYSNLGYACQMRGAAAKAADMYRKALSLNPDFAAARQNLAKLENRSHGTPN